MARTKRKKNILSRQTETISQKSDTPTIYQSAGYVRLSAEDSGKSGADTIEVQKKLIEDYINDNASMAFAGFYCDNGQTGTNFERPEFERLMTDVRKGTVNCIVVKDLSRFGRNYKETGNYLERIFPFLGIRFVAINDHFDTLQIKMNSDAYIVPLKNIINEVYCKDLSKKISSVLETKQKEGKYIGSIAPYGYRKRQDNPHYLEVDTKTAPIVQQIFNWCLEGVSYTEIVRRLNQESILCPSKYLYRQGIFTKPKFNEAVWNVAAVKLILSNPVYIGHMVQGRHRQSFCEGKKLSGVLPEEWKVVKHTHPGIVDENIFKQVQEIKMRKAQAFHRHLGKYTYLGKSENIFTGKVFCADCTCSMVRYKAVFSKGTKATYSFICRTHSNYPDRCPTKYICEDNMKKVVFGLLKQHIQMAANISLKVRKLNQSSGFREKIESINSKIAALEQTVKSCEIFRESLYQNYVDQVMTEQEYLNMKKRYVSEIAQARGKIEMLRIEQQERRPTPESPYLTVCGQFQNIDVLTREMIEVLVEKILVGSNNRIEIVLRYRDEYESLLSYVEETEYLVKAK